MGKHINLSTTRIGDDQDETPVLIEASTTQIELVAHAVWDIARTGRLNSDVYFDIRPGDLTFKIGDQSYATDRIFLIYVDWTEYLLIQVNASEELVYFFVIQRKPNDEPALTTWDIPDGGRLVRLETDDETGGEPFDGLPAPKKLQMLLG